MEEKILYNGFIKVVERETPIGKREVMVADPAVAVLILNEQKNKVFLVKQYRAPAKKEIWEIPAGMMDVKGESPEKCAIREIQEETGSSISEDALTKMVSYYPNIGTTNHFLHIFKCVVNEEEVKDNLEVDDADVTEAKWFTFEEIYDMIKDNQIVDGKTMLAYYNHIASIVMN